MIRCKNFSPRLPTFFQEGKHRSKGPIPTSELIEALIAKGVLTHKAKPPKLTRWTNQLIDVCRHLTKSSVRKLVQGWLAISQKNTVVGGNFSYGC
jgi:hypothetical protein